jgi:hypothetical protein
VLTRGLEWRYDIYLNHNTTLTVLILFFLYGFFTIYISFPRGEGEIVGGTWTVRKEDIEARNTN